MKFDRQPHKRMESFSLMRNRRDVDTAKSRKNSLVSWIPCGLDRAYEWIANYPNASREIFSLLSYQTANLGDEIQSIAARKFLPKVDLYLDRENLNRACSPHEKPIKLIMNGWFCHHPENWPPAPCIDPLLISMHITDNPEPHSLGNAREVFSQMPQVLSYLQLHGPVGARDHTTLAWLQSHKIDSYFSGCLTLTLDRPSVHRENFVVLNDLPDTVTCHVQTMTDRPICSTKHNFGKRGTEIREQQALALLDLYARASCAVTTRLHCALPCLAMGTPVLLIDAHWDQARFGGLNELVHHCSVEEFMSGTFVYDINDPPPNPRQYESLRTELEQRASAFTGKPLAKRNRPR